MMNTQNTEAYRIAGELFGRLQDALSSGDLVMSKNHQFNSIEFKLTFHIHGEPYAIEENVSMQGLLNLINVEPFATRISRRWEAELQRKREEARDLGLVLPCQSDSQ